LQNTKNCNINMKIRLFYFCDYISCDFHLCVEGKCSLKSKKRYHFIVNHCEISANFYLFRELRLTTRRFGLTTRLKPCVDGECGRHHPTTEAVG
jgi:hypothetical protein